MKLWDEPLARWRRVLVLSKDAADASKPVVELPQDPHTGLSGITPFCAGLYWFVPKSTVQTPKGWAGAMISSIVPERT